MGHSQADKARNRERILEEAAARIRRDGLESISVAGLMEAVGLTHGGFYNHFDSRAELLAEALAEALQLGAANSRAGDAGATGDASDERSRFDAFVRGYLSSSHRDHPESGCAIAALVCDVGRGEPALKETMSGQVEGLFAKATRAIGDEGKAMLAISAMVGALALSRVTGDRERSDALLRAVRTALRAL